jgi:formylglycine-generating enzyme required for sulfatase activity
LVTVVVGVVALTATGGWATKLYFNKVATERENAKQVAAAQAKKDQAKKDQEAAALAQEELRRQEQKPATAQTNTNKFAAARAEPTTSPQVPPPGPAIQPPLTLPKIVESTPSTETVQPKPSDVSHTDVAQTQKPKAQRDLPAPSPTTIQVVQPPRTPTKVAVLTPTDVSMPQSAPVAPPAATNVAALSPFNPAGRRFTNSLGMVFVPVGKVWFSIWQTRAGDFKQYQEAAKADAIGSLANCLNGPPDMPVRDLNWEQARVFCGWLTEKDRTNGLLPPAGIRYRLPWDSEWSAAAGIGSEPGQTPEKRMAGLQWSLDTSKMNDNFHPFSVASGDPNRQGLYHLGNNGAEWCEDSYADYPPTKTYRTSAVLGDAEPKTRYRGRIDSSGVADWLGFRCVLDPGADHDSLVAGGISNPEQNNVKK